MNEVVIVSRSSNWKGNCIRFINQLVLVYKIAMADK